MNLLKWLMDILFGWVPYVPKAIWHMWSLDRSGTTWYKIRAFSFLILEIWVVLDGFSTYKDYQNFSVLYPKYNDLYVDEGNLTKMKYAKGQHDLTLVKSDNTSIHIHSKYGIYSAMDDWYHDKNHTPLNIAVPVTIRWFNMPSEMAWIAELERNGEIVVSYQKAKEDFYMTKNYNEKWSFYTFWIPFFCLLIIIFFEASIIRKTYQIREKQWHL